MHVEAGTLSRGDMYTAVSTVVSLGRLVASHNVSMSDLRGYQETGTDRCGKQNVESWNLESVTVLNPLTRQRGTGTPR